MRIACVIIFLLGLMSCQPTKPDNDLFKTVITNEIDVPAKVAMALISYDSITQGIVDGQFAMVEVTLPLYTTPCIAAGGTYANLNKADNAPKVVIECALLPGGPYRAGWVWVMQSTGRTQNWVMVPALILPGTTYGDKANFTKRHVRANPSDYGHDILVQF